MVCWLIACLFDICRVNDMSVAVCFFGSLTMLMLMTSTGISLPFVRGFSSCYHRRLCADQQSPLKLLTHGKPMNKWMNELSRQCLSTVNLVWSSRLSFLASSALPQYHSPCSTFNEAGRLSFLLWRLFFFVLRHATRRVRPPTSIERPQRRPLEQSHYSLDADAFRNNRTWCDNCRLRWP